MITQTMQEAVLAFLAERGHDPKQFESGTEAIELGSLEYVALLLYVEKSLDMAVDDGIFFEEGLPSTLDHICERLMLAAQT
ncbi:hypothetical protein [Brevibacillus dissolubilis]|uniref:hypothetical protein n=1 Tax=Brevibacillus dissolubilis TaxID=1844116 RepID=UPI001115DA80|nr:hypothetical protein [Brevibacillus dissolubilis]